MPGTFLSYAREDLPFVRRLYDALAAQGHEPSWDQDPAAIPFSAPWRQEIVNGIAGSDKFVFVISPDSLDSGPCADELAHAVASHKHIVPVLRRPPREGQVVPDAIGELNWIFFDDDAAFDRALAQLAETLTTDLDWVRAHTRLLVRSSEWESRQRDRSVLLHGNDLRAAEEWLSHADGHDRTPPTELQRRYVLASRRAADRSARIWRSALASGLVIALGLATVAYLQRNQARHEALVAQARALAAEATAVLSTDPTESLSLALQSTKVDPSAAGTEALRLALAGDRLRMAFEPGFGSGTQATWSPVGEIIAATGAGNSVQLWNPRTGRLVRRLGSLPAADPITQLLYDRTGDRLAAVSSAGMVAMWDPSTGATVDLGKLDSAVRAEEVSRLAQLGGDWDPRTGLFTVYGAGVRGLIAFDVRTGAVQSLAGPPLDDVVFGPSGSRAFIEGGFGARIFDFATGSAVDLPSAIVSGWGVTGEHQACFTPDGSELATWDPVEAQDQVLRIFDTRSGKELFERAGATFSAAACGSSAAVGPYVAAGDYDGQAVLVQTSSVRTTANRPAQQEFTASGLFGHTQRIESVAVSADSRFVATASDDGTVRVWDAVSGRLLSLIAGDAEPVERVQFSPDGGLVLAVEANGVIRVADSGVGEPAVRLSASGAGTVYALGFAAGGRLVYGVGEVTRESSGGGRSVVAETALEWNSTSGALRGALRLPSPPATGTPACPPSISSFTFCNLVAPPQEFSGLSVSADGSYLAYATHGAVVVRAFSGSRHARLAVGSPVTGLSFAGPDDELLVMTNRTVYLWHPLSGASALSISQPSPPIDAELSANGARLATADVGGTATVFDASSGRAVATFFPQHVHVVFAGAPVPIRVALDQDGRELAIGTDFGSVELWQVPAHRLLATHLIVPPGPAGDTYPIAELSFTGGGDSLLAVDYPQIGAGDQTPPGTSLLLSKSGRIVSTLLSPGQVEPPTNPGVALSPGGSYVLAGVEGFAPATDVAGQDAVYSLTGGQQLADFQGAVATAPPAVPGPNLVPFSAWAPDGVHLLVGSAGVYACDACGSAAQMQQIAQRRLAWTPPLRAADDRPPAGNAFG